jgi:hypothetical protein
MWPWEKQVKGSSDPKSDFGALTRTSRLHREGAGSSGRSSVLDPHLRTTGTCCVGGRFDSCHRDDRTQGDCRREKLEVKTESGQNGVSLARDPPLVLCHICQPSLASLRLHAQRLWKTRGHQRHS